MTLFPAICQFLFVLELVADDVTGFISLSFYIKFIGFCAIKVLNQVSQKSGNFRANIAVSMRQNIRLFVYPQQDLLKTKHFFKDRWIFCIKILNFYIILTKTCHQRLSLCVSKVSDTTGKYT